MEFDPILLSRIQFAFLVTLHIVFPAFTIGLAVWLAVVEAMSMATGKAIYRTLFDFWLKVFAISFGMGVVSGIVMAFQFGTNWSELAVRTGSIQGPLLGYEAFTAFLLEATFFGIVLFGRRRVPSGIYLLSCWMVAIGTTFSSFWILANNSWMQVPVGYQMVDGKIIPSDWRDVIWGHVFRIRWLHMLVAAYLTTAMCVAATGAWYLLRNIHLEAGRLMLRWGLALAALAIVPQLWLGHLNGEYIEHYQPSKFTAVEGRWQTEQPARLILFAWPDPESERNLLEIAIPVLGSFVDDGDFTSEEPGIVTVPRDERPPIAVPFFGFRIMVALGVLIWAVSWGGCVLALFGALERIRAFLWCTCLSFPAGFVAVIAGWFTAEVGRQPWTVYGLLKTADAHTPTLTGTDVLITLLGYAAVYGFIYTFGFYYLYRLMRTGPVESEAALSRISAKRPFAAGGSAESVTGRKIRARD